MNEVSVVVTACDRLDLLERTLRSFLHYNSYPLTKLYIRDDSGLSDVWKGTFDLLSTITACPIGFDYPARQLGQAASIDRLMRMVTTPYVFHLEDDWEFDRGGFIEDCFEVMNKDVSQVRVRHRLDGSATQTKEWLDTADLCTNHLFSFNPHLRKTDLIDSFVGKNERMLGDWVEVQNLDTLWLKNGACRHIGGNKTTNRSGTPYQAGVRKA